MAHPTSTPLTARFLNLTICLMTRLGRLLPGRLLGKCPTRLGRLPGPRLTRHGRLARRRLLPRPRASWRLPTLHTFMRPLRCSPASLLQHASIAAVLTHLTGFSHGSMDRCGASPPTRRPWTSPEPYSLSVAKSLTGSERTPLCFGSPLRSGN